MICSVVYQAYGNKSILHELLYSIYSLIRQYECQPSFSIIIYTDDQKYLSTMLPDWIEYRYLPLDEVRIWSGPDKFVHRVKIMVLLDFIKTHNGKLLYVDTDTVFLKPVDDLFDKIDRHKYIMHVEEGLLSSPRHLLFQKISSFLKRNPDIDIDHNVVVYNAGVIGLACVEENTLQTILNLTDKLYSGFPKHIMEQIAFSSVFSTNGYVQVAVQSVFHYWNFKEFRQVLSDFFEFNSSLPYMDIVSKINQIDPKELIKPKIEYEQLSFWPKAFRKLKDKRWTLPQYMLS